MSRCDKGGLTASRKVVARLRDSIENEVLADCPADLFVNEAAARLDEKTTLVPNDFHKIDSNEQIRSVGDGECDYEHAVHYYKTYAPTVFA